MPKDTMNGLVVTVGQYSSAGRKPENQDFHGASIPEGDQLALKGVVLAIADGISSSRVSREASEICVRAMMTEYYATPEAWSVRTCGEAVLGATNAWLHGRNTGDVNEGFVCTLSALVLKGRQGHVLHVGDSRVSRLVGASLEPLTVDHRAVLSPDESYLARAMGAAAELAVDYTAVPLAVGDVFVLTTDGVHEHVSGRVVVDALGADTLDAAAEKVARAALEAGSGDNLTVQIVRVESLPVAGEVLETEAATLPLPVLPKAGDMLDGFRILRPVHSTARSHVFLAEGPSGKVALKVPTQEMAQDAAHLRRFALEEWIAGRVRSSHVVGAVPSSGRTALYVVTEWVEGVTLRQWMVDHPRASLDQVRGIVGQIAMGLRALHRREMIHQDLRPENVMIDSDGTVKLIDLGSCFVTGVEEAAPGTLPQLPGTFQYTAPEVMAGDAVSVRADQFALGVIAYEMLTGRLPYGAQVGRITARRDVAGLRYAPARAEDNAVPDWMDAALKKALSPYPAHRYAALSEFVADLTRPGSVYRAGNPVPLVERNPVRFWQGVSGVLAVLCTVLIFLMMTQGG